MARGGNPRGGVKIPPLARHSRGIFMVRPFGAPQKGSKKGQKYFSTLPCDFWGVRATLQGAGRPLRGHITRKPLPLWGEGVKVRHLGRAAA